MARQFGVPNVTRPPAFGGNPPAASHSRADTLRDSNSLAGEPPRRLNLAVIGSSFLRKRELNPVQELDAVFDYREFAAYFFVSVFGVSIGVLLAIAVALLDWS